MRLSTVHRPHKNTELQKVDNLKSLHTKIRDTANTSEKFLSIILMLLH